MLARMSEKTWMIRLQLSNGETRHLSLGQLPPEQAIDAFQNRREPFSGDWLETTDASIVARAHVVEAAAVPG